ncbi:glycoside hydrolase family 44 protein [Paenibacillus sp. GYB003]|uniref:glycoside hydrolase family 44 protein n=1 Tax=Paenibacillus sp. GYB003 TaxID=2994392 RepID=UPI002F96D52B
MMAGKLVAYRRTVAVVLAALLLLMQWTVAAPRAIGDASGSLIVYDDALSAEFVNYSWADMELAVTDTVYSGNRAIRLDPDGGKALYFYKDRIMNADEYGTFRFWIHGGATGGQRLKLVFSLGGQSLAETELGDALPGGVPAGKWAEVRLRLADLGVRGLVDGIWLWGEDEQEPVYLDDIAFVAGGGGHPGGEPQPQPQTVVGLVYGEAPITLRAGGSRTIELAARLSDGTTSPAREKAAWSSDDEAVAAVSGGVAVGLKPGTATIRAGYAGFEARMTVRVVEAAPTGPIEPVDGIYVFDDALNGQFTDYSWASRSLEEADIVHTGSRSVRFEPDRDDGLYLYSDRPITVKDYEKLRLWVNGGSGGGQQVKLVFMAGGQPAKEMRLGDLIPGGIPANGWAKLELMLADLELPNGLFDGLLLAGAGVGDQQAVYVDDIALVRKYVAPPAIVEVRMDVPQLVLLKDETKRLTAESMLDNGVTNDVTGEAAWQSDRPDVVRVDRGALTAVANGIAKITASFRTYTATAYVQVAEVAPETVYADELADGFRNQSWHDKDLANTEQARSGVRSIKFEPDGWDGVWLVSDRKRSVADYYGIELWLHGGTAGGQKLTLHAYNGGSSMGAVDLSRYAPGSSLPAGQWSHIVVNFADMGLRNEPFDGLIVQAATEDDQAAVYIDDIAFLRNLNPGLPEPELPAVQVKIDAQADRRPINPDIYGINYDDMHPTESQLAFPVQRWGGNNTTRYNWELDVANRASDWYFINYPYENDRPEQLPHGSMSDRFIDMVHGKNGKVLLTVPTIGWTPKSREVTYGFSQKKYGPQQSGARELPDAGNGVFPGGELVTGNDPLDTSKRIGPDFVTRWIDHIGARTGNRVNFYALDNEPEIWHVTHRDVHPQAPTYDEIWGFTETYGAAIKAKDPDANIFGPTSWGWCAYFYSSADNCADGPDRQAHEGKPFLEWYLQKVRQYEQATGVRLVDYLDIHYYPQENGVPTDDEGPATAKRRFQALKALYDPNFIDRSWIQEPIRLIPRMKEMIERHAPGTKLAITEYNFGNGDGITAGLAQAEALALFGREGVDLATRFGTLPAGTPLEDAFKLYLNYDGKGGRIEGDSVRATSTIADAVGAYAIVSPQGKTFVLLFNKDTVSRVAEVDGSFAEGVQGELYRFDARQRLAFDGHVQTANGGFAVKLPARSAALIAVPQ